MGRGLHHRRRDGSTPYGRPCITVDRTDAAIDVGESSNKESMEMSVHMTLEPRRTISVVQERRSDRDRELVEALRLHEPTSVQPGELGGGPPSHEGASASRVPLAVEDLQPS